MAAQPVYNTRLIKPQHARPLGTGMEGRSEKMDGDRGRELFIGVLGPANRYGRWREICRQTVMQTYTYLDKYTEI